MLTSSPLSAVYLCAIIAMMIGHAWLCARRGRFLVLDPLNTFWGGALVCYVWQPIVHFDSLVSWRGVEIIERTLLLIVLSVAGLILGYEARLGRRIALRIPAMHAQLAPNPMRLSGLGVTALGLLGYAYLVASAGSWSAWLSHGRGGTDWGSVSGYWAQLIYLLPVGLSILLFHVGFHAVAGLERILVWTSGFVYWLWIVYLGSRSMMIGFTLVLLSAYYLPRRRNPPLALAAALAAGMLVLVQFQAAYRSRFTNLTILGNLDPEEVRASSSEWLVSGSSRTSEANTGLEFNCAAAVVEIVPERVDYNFGYAHLEKLTRPIPRALWPDKIYPALRAHTPIYREGGLSATPIATSKEPLLAGPTLTFLGHWYAVGGFLAVALAAFATGALFRALRRVYDRQPGNEGDVMLYAMLFPIGFTECAAEPLIFVFTLPFPILALLLVVRFSAARPQVAPAGAS